MTTLTTTPLAPLLNRLFEEADSLSPMASPTTTNINDEDLARLMRSKTDYRDFYERLKDFPLAVSRETGTLLYMLARSCGARTIVEFGTSFGISTLHLAAALRDNGGGRLITSEFELSKVRRARENLTAGGLIDLVEIREGRRAANLEHRPPRNDRSAAARWRQSAVSRNPEFGREPSQTGRTYHRGQRRLQPRISGARACARTGLFVHAVCRRRRTLDVARLTLGIHFNSIFRQPYLPVKAIKNS